MRNVPDWVEPSSSDDVQPWAVHDQHPFISVRQRDGGDPDTIHWVLIPKDEVEAFIEQVRNTAK